MSKRIKLTKEDVLMLDNLIYFNTMPDEYKLRLEKIIKHSQGLPYNKVEKDNERVF